MSANLFIVYLLITQQSDILPHTVSFYKISVFEREDTLYVSIRGKFFIDENIGFWVGCRLNDKNTLFGNESLIRKTTDGS